MFLLILGMFNLIIGFIKLIRTPEDNLTVFYLVMGAIFVLIAFINIATEFIIKEIRESKNENPNR